MLGWRELLLRGGELDCCFFGPPLPFFLLLFVSAPVSLEFCVSLILCSHVKLTLLDDIVWGFVKAWYTYVQQNVRTLGNAWFLLYVTGMVQLDPGRTPTVQSGTLVPWLDWAEPQLSPSIERQCPIAEISGRCNQTRRPKIKAFHVQQRRPEL